MKWIILSGLLLSTIGCSSGPGQVSGNENGSLPINAHEEVAYKKAVARCYKTGGSRIVKIDGKLRCF